MVLMASMASKKSLGLERRNFSPQKEIFIARCIFLGYSKYIYFPLKFQVEKCSSETLGNYK